MPTLQIEHGVRDFDAWRRAFDSDPIGRAQHGVRGHRIRRPVDDSAYVIVDLEFDSVDEADTFRTALKGLWSRMGDELGLEDPRARIVETVDSAGV